MSVLHVKYVYHACSSHRGTATIFVLGMEPVSFARANSSTPLLYIVCFSSVLCPILILGIFKCERQVLQAAC